ncbi:MAG: hypothetical protein H5T69_16845 [Chloroflexi bacterium]|nr:hypothetical protein [Chloroflexota bacterium]
MNRFERVMAAIDRQPVDRFPADIWCVQEVRDRLLDHCGTDDWMHVLDALDIDGIINLRPPYIGPALPDLGEEYKCDEWGFVTRRQCHGTGFRG